MQQGSSSDLQPRWSDYFLVYALVFTSGGLLYQTHQEPFLIAFFLGAVALAFYHVARLSAPFLVYMCAFVLMLFVVHLYTHGSLPVTSVIGTTMQLILAYLVLALTKERFTRVYTRLILFLASISLVGYTVDQLPFLSDLAAGLPSHGEFTEGFLYVFGYQKHIDRNISIFFEPAVYQSFLNVAVFLVLFTDLGLSMRRKAVYLLICSVALFTTFSTTGFLIFAVLMSVAILRSGRLHSGVVLGGVLGVAVVVGLFWEKVEYVVIEKIAHYQSSDSLEEGVTMRRKFDVLADMSIFRENIWGSGFETYTEKFQQRAVDFVRQGRPDGSSNGLTRMLAVFGLPFSLFVWASMLPFFFLFIRDWVLRIGAITMVAMFFSAETLVLRPFALCLIAALFVYWERHRRELVPEHQPGGFRV